MVADFCASAGTAARPAAAGGGGTAATPLADPGRGAATASSASCRASQEKGLTTQARAPARVHLARDSASPRPDRAMTGVVGAASRTRVSAGRPRFGASSTITVSTRTEIRRRNASSMVFSKRMRSVSGKAARSASHTARSLATTNSTFIGLVPCGSPMRYVTPTPTPLTPAAAATRGNVTVNDVPTPGTLSTSISPRCSVTIP